MRVYHITILALHLEAGRAVGRGRSPCLLLLRTALLAGTRRERAERQKLRRKTNKERKGAMRELRKDNAFLAAATAADTAKRDEYLEGRGKRALQIMEEQEASWKSMKREKSGRGVKPKKEPGASI